MSTPDAPSTTAITSPTPRLRRARRLRTGVRLSRPQDETHAPHRVQDTRLAVGLELASQVPDEDVGDVGLGVEVVAPHLFVEPLAGDHLAGTAHEDAEELQLPPRELQVAPGAQRAVARLVELEVADRDDAVALRRPPAQERVQPGDDLLERERLDHVIVGARLKPRDPVADLVTGREHAHRQLAPGRAQTT